MEKDTIIFDLETTGFNNSDDITQIAYLRIGSDLTLKDSYSKHINTDIVIEPKVISITGVNNMKLQYLSEGKYFEEVLPDFLHIFQEENIFMGHNISFDERMLKANVQRAGIELPKLNTRCTMKDLTEEMGLKGTGNKPKFPKLQEAFNYCSRKLGQKPSYFNKAFEDMFGEGTAHDALFDTYMTYICHAYLKASRG